MQELLTYLLLGGSIAYGAWFGKSSSKSLLWAAIVPAVTATVLLILNSVKNERPSNILDTVTYGSFFAVGYGVLLGIVGYFSARQYRKPKPYTIQGVLEYQGLFKHTTAYLVIFLIAISIGTELWRMFLA